MEKNELKMLKRHVRAKLAGSILALVFGSSAMFVGGLGLAYAGEKGVTGLIPLLIFLLGTMLIVVGVFLLPYKAFPFFEQDREGDLLRKELHKQKVRGKG